MQRLCAKVWWFYMVITSIHEKTKLGRQLSQQNRSSRGKHSLDNESLAIKYNAMHYSTKVERERMTAQKQKHEQD